MDWKPLLNRLTVGRLNKLADNAGLAGRRRRKAELVAAIHGCLDPALKHEVLALLSKAELVALAKRTDHDNHVAAKSQLIAALLQHDPRPTSLASAESPEDLADQGRGDIPQLPDQPPPVAILPSAPAEDDALLLAQMQQLFRRSDLNSVVLVQPCCNAGILPRLIVEQLDDFIEHLVQRRRNMDPHRPLLRIVLDAQQHGLNTGPVGPVLVALATTLPHRIELRLAPSNRSLDTPLFCFETSTQAGPKLVGFTGPSGRAEQADGKPRRPMLASLQLCGSLDDSRSPSSMLRDWMAAAIGQSTPQSQAQLEAYEQAQHVVSKIDYKRDFDTAHELALKHLAEQLARRGRFAHAFYDTSMVDKGHPHQDLAMAASAAPWLEGLLLLDESGLGKTVAVGQILSRELRRARIYGDPSERLRRRALIVCPQAQLEHWCNELQSKFNLHATSSEASALGSAIHDRLDDSALVVCSPQYVAAHWEEMQDIAVLVLDEPQLFDEKATAALHALRQHAALCLIASGHPIQSTLYDLVPLAALAAPHAAWEQWLELQPNDELFGRDLRSVALRSLRDPLLASGDIVAREVKDWPYSFDASESQAYQELQQMRRDYLERSGADTAWAFAALERCFLSSTQAFAAAAGQLLESPSGETKGDLFEQARDASFPFLTQSSYFRRRIVGILKLLGLRGRSDSPTAPKEFALSDLLAENSDQPVVLFSAYQTTRMRLARFIGDVFPDLELIQLDGKSPLADRERTLRRAVASRSQHSQGTSCGQVILCTDAAASGLNLQRASSTLINYDIPWNAHRMDRRIKSVHRLGQKNDVLAYNMLACDGASDGWTMDHRIIDACRSLFGLESPNGTTSPALVKIAPHELEATLAGSDSVELSIPQEPNPAPLGTLSNLLAGGETTWRSRHIKEQLQRDDAFRQLLQQFRRVSSGARDEKEQTEAYLHNRIQQALLQGSIGILCAPECTPESCTSYHLAAGLRIVYEAATPSKRQTLFDEDWRIEDEEVYLWAVSPAGKLIDWSGFLTGSSLRHVQPAAAQRLVSQPVLDYLIDCKGQLERHDLDSLPAEAVLDNAPGAIATRLFVATQRANAIAEARVKELSAEWSDHRAMQLQSFDARLAHARATGANEDIQQRIVARSKALKKREVKLRHQLLLTQLFIITHEL